VPWHVARSDSCPASKPYAVIKDSDGSVVACHPSERSARRQMAALYAQESLNKMQHKSFDIIETKADADAGTFEALVAVFGNVDNVGDRIIPGAFTKTLASWAGSGDPIPVILSHQWNDVMAHIGVVEAAKETGQGLLVKGRLDIKDNDVARQTHRLMQRRSLKEFSFGYRVPKGGERRAKDGANELLEIDLVEVGPTLKGANSATELHAVKSALGVEDPPLDANKQREEAKRVEREVEQTKIPEVPEPPKRDPEPEIDITKELQEVKDRLAKAETALEDLKKADVTDREPKARSVDPLRKQAENVALEIASGGGSLRKPPPTEAPKSPEPALELRELRQRTRDELLGVLSGGTINDE
jgi:HK97 family phage prohead protease